MADFNKAFEITMGHEGGYANNPNDNGGETYKGVARKFWPKWEGWKAIDAIKSKYGASAAIINKHAGTDAALQKAIKSFYKTNFWDVYSLDKVNDQAIAEEMFDTGVNMGIKVEAEFLQRALNLTNNNGKLFKDLFVDGDIGPITLGVLNNHPNKKLVLKILNVMQGARYIDIAERNKTQEMFINSWFSRVSA